MRKFVFILFVAVTTSAKAQDEDLVKSMLNSIGLNSAYVLEEKASIPKLDSFDLTEIKNEYAMEGKTLLLADTTIMQLFEKTSNNPSKLYWTPAYFPNRLLVKSREEYLDLKEVLRQHKIERNTQSSIRVESLVHDWNSRRMDDRSVAFCSNPIFDNSKRYTLIEYGYSSGNLGGRSWLKIFEFSNGAWSEIVYVTGKIS